MKQMDMSKYLPCTARLVGGTLYILDGEGRVQRRLDPLQTAIEWFQMSNDAFYALYGVNWVPNTFSWALWYGGGRAAKSTHQWKRPK